jgi:hypothetical protein
MFATLRFLVSLPVGGYWQSRFLIDLVPLLFVLVVTIACVRKQPPAYTAFVAGLLLVVLVSPVVDSPMSVYFIATGRYMLAAVPIFLVVGRWMGRYSWLDALVTSGGLLLQAAFVTYFILGGWLI